MEINSTLSLIIKKIENSKEEYEIVQLKHAIRLYNNLSDFIGDCFEFIITYENDNIKEITLKNKYDNLIVDEWYFM